MYPTDQAKPSLFHVDLMAKTMSSSCNQPEKVLNLNTIGYFMSLLISNKTFTHKTTYIDINLTLQFMLRHIYIHFYIKND